ncbi:MAG: restriction endonuclease subunit S [Candidatus Micrarchaeota archaeon]|nr:restriction endonuclease subunit S [Candidatus Micrarchaeota archaeon]
MDTKYKETEIGLVPKEWNIVRLGDIVHILDKKRVPLSEDIREKRRGIYPYCGANGIIDNINEYIFDGEFVLLAEDGGYWGKYQNSAYIMNGKFWVNNHAHILDAIKEKTSNHFLVNYLIYTDMSNLIGGDARGKLTQQIMKSIPIALPPLDEQKNIINIISAVQQTREKTERVINSLNELKKSAIKHFFTYGVVKFESIDKVKLRNTEFGKIPENWLIIKLNDIFTITSGKARPNDLKTAQVAQHIYPVYGGNGIMGYSDKYLLESDSIVIGRVGEYCGATYLTKGKCWISDNALYIKELKKETDLHYLKLALEYLDLNRFKNTGGQPLISQSIIYSKYIPFPTLIEQEKISSIILKINEKIESEEKKRVALEETFKSLLSNLMTGKIRVNDIKFGS